MKREMNIIGGQAPHPREPNRKCRTVEGEKNNFHDCPRMKKNTKMAKSSRRGGPRMM